MATELFKQASAAGLLDHLTVRVCRSLVADFAAVLDTDARGGRLGGELPGPTS